MKSLLYLFLLPALFYLGCSPDTKEDKAIEDEMNHSLQTEILDAWYPLTVDTVYGGFLSNFTFDWQPRGPQNKMIVTQTRHLWALSGAAMFYKNDGYQNLADHAYKYLRDAMWDKEDGGFYTTLSREGKPGSTDFGGSKMAYGNAFGIYALSAYYELTGNEEALNLAKKDFQWLEEYSHDPVYGGYFNNLNRDGSPLSVGGMDKAKESGTSPEQLPDYDRISQKDQNTSIHILEALTALYKVWPDSLLRKRLREMFSLIADTIVTDRGSLTLFLTRDWKPISLRDSSESYIRRRIDTDHISFGHNIETAYLLLEASQVLNGKPDKKTLALAKKMVDQTLKYGWDRKVGGIFDKGYFFKGSDTITIVSNVKVWWSQAEALNSCLLMSKLYPAEKEKYRDYFKKEWNYLNTYQIDHKHKGWYEEGLDNSPRQVSAPKATDWKIDYHNSRALMNCIKMLRGEDELTKGL